MEISGKIKIIKEIQSIGASGFKKRELIVNTNEQYPQILLIEFIQDNCELLNRFSVDDEVIISINLRGREWKNTNGEIKYYNTFLGWKINKIDEANEPPTPPSQNKVKKEDDVPF